jgi:hypothetical protein
MNEIRFSTLSKVRQILIRLCQRVNYGSIQNVQVVDGDISFTIPPDVHFDVKLDGDITQREELNLTDFALPVESCRLMTQIDSLKNGVLERIAVHEGIPRRVLLRGTFTELSV